MFTQPNKYGSIGHIGRQKRPNLTDRTYKIDSFLPSRNPSSFNGQESDRALIVNEQYIWVPCQCMGPYVL